MDDERAPAHRCVGGERLLVARPVAGDLGAPIVGVGLRRPRAARAIMAVPEAAVHENRELAGDVDDVGLTRQIAAMKPVARRDLAQKRADRKLRARVARFDRAHDRRAVVGHSIAHLRSNPCRWSAYDESRSVAMSYSAATSSDLASSTRAGSRTC